jgi:hypothetical protein
MICPNCKCQYIRGVTECADCGVALVDSLDSTAHREEEARDPEDAVSVWGGTDPSACTNVRMALVEAGIAVVDQERTGNVFFPSLQSRKQIYVSSADVERAKKVLGALGIGVIPEDLTEEERAALALPESDLPDEDEATELNPDSPEDWDEDDPVAEVWSGDDEDLADTLTACLREIGIGSKKVSEAGHWRLLVREQHEARAKEVVREVVEASPPE